MFRFSFSPTCAHGRPQSSTIAHRAVHCIHSHMAFLDFLGQCCNFRMPAEYLPADKSQIMVDCYNSNGAYAVMQAPRSTGVLAWCFICRRCTHVYHRAMRITQRSLLLLAAVQRKPVTCTHPVADFRAALMTISRRIAERGIGTRNKHHHSMQTPLASILQVFVQDHDENITSHLPESAVGLC